MTRKNNGGFSVIEAMVVLVVLATLAAMAFPGMAKRVNYSKRAEARVSLGTISRMQDAHYQTRGRYAATMDELGFRTDIGGSHGRRYQFNVIALDGGAAYAVTATANLDGDAFQDVLVVVRGGSYHGDTMVVRDDITNLAQPVSLCFRAGSNDRNGDGNGNAGQSRASNDRNGDGNGNAGQGDGGRRTCVQI